MLAHQVLQPLGPRTNEETDSRLSRAYHLTQESTLGHEAGTPWFLFWSSILVDAE